MSQVSNLSSAAAIPGNRAPTGLSSIASFDRPPVDGISAGVGVNFNDASFRFENEKQHIDGERARSGSSSLSSRSQSKFSAPSQTFAAMFEMSDIFGQGGNSVAIGGRGFVGLTAKAVHIYETTSRVIHGANNPLGASLSINL